MGFQQDCRQRAKAVSAGLKNHVIRYCYRIIRSLEHRTPDTLFDLSPTRHADHVKPYLDRLTCLIEQRSDRVHEIAITGPYSSGKTSLLKTFEHRNPQHKYIWISLASFDNPKAENTVDGINGNTPPVQPLEKSIVQQLLYRSKSDSVSGSRFRRIYTRPMKSWFTATLLAWLVVSSFLYSTDALSWDAFLLPYNWIEFWMIVFSSSVFLLLIKDILSTIRQFDISKLSFYNVELAFVGDADSIFNKYLEEILYHLKANQTDIVIFEDLDRFPGNEIFVRLKELNTIINHCKDIERPVRFIYAVQDDLFKNAERVKFFDAIIPVIPITNESNAYPIFKDLLEQAGIDADIDDQMLREVMIFVDDMRILKNIINEFMLYRAILWEGNDKAYILDRLMGFMIYKNYYCDDFAKLQNSEGILIDLFNAANQVRSTIKQDLAEEIQGLADELDATEDELLTSVEELNIVFQFEIMKDYSKITGQHAVTKINEFDVDDVVKPKNFIVLMEAGSIHISSNRGNHRTRTNLYSPLLKEDGEYQRRLRVVQSKIQKRQDEIREQLQRLQAQVSESVSLPIERLCKEHQARWRQNVRAVLNNQNRPEKQFKLLLALMENGYLDEQYHKFIAMFKPGHISSGDHHFVLSVNSNEPLDPTYALDEVSAVFDYLKANSRLHNRSFMNYDLINYLFDIDATAPLKTMLSTLSITPEVIRMLWDSVNHVSDESRWLYLLAHTVPSYWALLTKSDLTDSLKHPLLINSLSQVTPKEINSKLADTELASLRSYFEIETAFFNTLPDDKNDREALYDRLQALKVKVLMLEGINNLEVINEIFTRKFFRFSPENMAIIFNVRNNEDSELPLNYEQLQEDQEALDALEAHRELVSDWVLEDSMTISSSGGWLDFLNHPEIDDHLRRQLIDHHSCKIDEIQSVESKELWESIVSGRKMACNWENVLTWLSEVNDGQLDRATFSAYINDPAIADELTDQLKVNLSDEDMNVLQSTIQSDVVKLDAFQVYEPYFGLHTVKEDIPNISTDKLSFLIHNDGFEQPDFELFEIVNARDPKLGLALIETYSKIYLEPGTMERIKPDSGLLLLIDESQALGKENKKQLFESSESIHELIVKRNALPNILTPHRKYQANEAIPQVPNHQIESVLNAKVSQDTKRMLVVSQMQYLSIQQVIVYLIQIDEAYSALEQADNTIAIAYSEDEKILAEALKANTYIKDFEISVGGLLSSKPKEIIYYSLDKSE